MDKKSKAELAAEIADLKRKIDKLTKTVEELKDQISTMPKRPIVIQPYPVEPWPMDFPPNRPYTIGTDQKTPTVTWKAASETYADLRDQG